MTAPASGLKSFLKPYSKSHICFRLMSQFRDNCTSSHKCKVGQLGMQAIAAIAILKAESRRCRQEPSIHNWTFPGNCMNAQGGYLPKTVHTKQVLHFQFNIEKESGKGAQRYAMCRARAEEVETGVRSFYHLVSWPRRKDSTCFWTQSCSGEVSG